MNVEESVLHKEEYYAGHRHVDKVEMKKIFMEAEIMKVGKRVQGEKEIWNAKYEQIVKEVGWKELT